MTDWMVAPCLDTLLAQVNKFAPQRSKRSDGSIGDAAHAARKSEHNPLKLPFCPKPLVRARDFTHDPVKGFDCGLFVPRMVALKDARVKYIIWDWKIWYPSTGWQPYSGVNGHTSHCHVSVRDDPGIMSEHVWNIPIMTSAVLPAVPNAAPAGQRILAEGATGDDVWKVQDWMNRMYPGYVNTPIPRVNPPRFGPQTKRVVIEFQRALNLAPDGIIGPQVWAAMAKEGYR